MIYSYSALSENLSAIENCISKQTNPENLLAASSTSSSSSRSSIIEEKIITENIRQDNLLLEKLDQRVDKVYTVGCFDLFHYGHIHLFERMSSMGKKLIVGVHDSRRFVK